MIVALFPGQGSQHVGMGDFLIKESPVAKQIFEEASDTLGFNMIELCLKGPEQKLQQTEFTQPALLTASVASFRVVQEKIGFKVAGGAGHSVGEYAALVTSGVLKFSKALELVKLRGKLMQETVPIGKGAMLAIMGLEESDVLKMCQWAMKETGLSPLEPANFNSPGQIVISGNAKIIEWLHKNLNIESIGISKKPRMIPLKVSAPFHCSMMKTAESEMAGAIKDVDFNSPSYPIAQNFTGQIETDPEKIRENIILQISGAVRWVDCIHSLKKSSPQMACEFGPGKVLTGLLKKIDPDSFDAFNINSVDELHVFERSLSQIKVNQ
jgi:[acyl-carrier-protein] S-malonyltransferase